MISLRPYRRYALIPLAGLALAAYYLLAFEPLARRARNLDEPLNLAWRRLAISMEQTNSLGLDFQLLTNQLAETRQSLAILEKAKQEAAVRLQLNPALQAKMGSTFQLVDYQNERSKQMDDLDRRAKAEKVAIEPLFWSGFPEHTADATDPAILWPALAYTQALLDTALRCKISAIHALEVPVALTNSPVLEPGGRWDEIPVQVEFTATADAAVHLLQSLPLRPEEIVTAGLPAAATNKLPMFIDRLIVKKQTPEKTDEVRVWVRALGYVLRE
jgi:hypothetical protein